LRIISNIAAKVQNYSLFLVIWNSPHGLAHSYSFTETVFDG